jgi:hypothetical protein
MSLDRLEISVGSAYTYTNKLYIICQVYPYVHQNTSAIISAIEMSPR